MESESTFASEGGCVYGFVSTSLTTFMVVLMFENYHIWKTKMIVSTMNGQRNKYSRRVLMLRVTKKDEWDMTGMIRRFMDDSVHNHIPIETNTYGS